MSRYETEEEQVDAIKAWWKKNGTSLLTTILIFVLAFSGWRYWNNHNQVQAINASSAFEVMQLNMEQGTFGEVSREALKLMQEQPKSPYAAASAMLLAKYVFSKGEVAEAQQHLEWINEHATDKALKDIAMMRLARILADQKQFDEAKSVLSKVGASQLMPTEKGHFDYISGVIALEQGDFAGARDAFKSVVDNLATSKTLQGLAQIQLDDLPTT